MRATIEQPAGIDRSFKTRGAYINLLANTPIYSEEIAPGYRRVVESFTPEQLRAMWQTLPKAQRQPRAWGAERPKGQPSVLKQFKRELRNLLLNHQTGSGGFRMAHGTKEVYTVMKKFTRVQQLADERYRATCRTVARMSDLDDQQKLDFLLDLLNHNLIFPGESATLKEIRARIAKAKTPEQLKKAQDYQPYRPLQKIAAAWSIAKKNGNISFLKKYFGDDIQFSSAWWAKIAVEETKEREVAKDPIVGLFPPTLAEVGRLIQSGKWFEPSDRPNSVEYFSNWKIESIREQMPESPSITGIGTYGGAMADMLPESDEVCPKCSGKLRYELRLLRASDEADTICYHCRCGYSARDEVEATPCSSPGSHRSINIEAMFKWLQKMSELVLVKDPRPGQPYVPRLARTEAEQKLIDRQRRGGFPRILPLGVIINSQ